MLSFVAIIGLCWRMHARMGLSLLLTAALWLTPAAKLEASIAANDMLLVARARASAGASARELDAVFTGIVRDAAGS